ncbi:hypothetical protein ACH3XW_34735 [Acanthocheilonema viteae]
MKSGSSPYVISGWPLPFSCCHKSPPVSILLDPASPDAYDDICWYLLHGEGDGQAVSPCVAALIFACFEKCCNSSSVHFLLHTLNMICCNVFANDATFLVHLSCERIRS